MATTHTCRGVSILPCSYVESRDAGYRWYIPSVHPTGIPYGEQDSARYHSLAEARADIRERSAREA